MKTFDEAISVLYDVERLRAYIPTITEACHSKARQRFLNMLINEAGLKVNDKTIALARIAFSAGLATGIEMEKAEW